jgi:hypothetical protein
VSGTRHEVQRTGLVVEQELLDAVRAGGVLGNVAVELDVASVDAGLEQLRGRVVGAVHLQVGIDLRVDVHGFLDEALALLPAP